MTDDAQRELFCEPPPRTTFVVGRIRRNTTHVRLRWARAHAASGPFEGPFRVEAVVRDRALPRRRVR